LLHDSLRSFLKANSQSLKRHVWSTAGSPAALDAWSGTTATMQVTLWSGSCVGSVWVVPVGCRSVGGLMEWKGPSLPTLAKSPQSELHRDSQRVFACRTWEAGVQHPGTTVAVCMIFGKLCMLCARQQGRKHCAPSASTVISGSALGL
jgi:hypothetical protein